MLTCGVGPGCRVVAAGLVALAGSTTAAGPIEPAADEVVLVATGNPDQPFAFEPAELTVAAGTTVRWRNTTADVFHTVTFSDSPQRRAANGDFDESLFAAGDVVEHTFDEPGTFSYFCQPHSEFMAGTIMVTEATGSTVWRWWVAGIAVASIVVAGPVIIQRRARRTVGDA